MRYTQNDLLNNYEKNLKLFQKHLPNEYKKLIIQSNETYALELTEYELNISKNGQLIYPQNRVDEYFTQMFETYRARGKDNLLKYKLFEHTYDISYEEFGADTINMRYQHNIHTDYIKKFDSSPIYGKPDHDFIYTMMIYGIGLGYHILSLIKEYQIKHIIIADIDIEMLRASLYSIDWSIIFNYLFEPDKHRTLTIIIEEKKGSLLSQIGTLLDKHLPLGCFNMAQFASYQDPVFLNKVSEIIKTLHFYVGEYRGFFDDEKWSLQHTIHNINEKTPLLAQTEFKVDEKSHVFLVANGPSLDKYIDIIKNYKDDVTIIAAGSALSSLYKYNIKPDFLVQTERHHYAYIGTSSYCDRSFFKDITLISATSIHPKLISLFDKKYIFCKGSDSSTQLLHRFQKENKYPELYYCNPTVSNTALSVALYLGFKNISFFGMDFGYKSTAEHHSKNSMYYNEESMFHKEELSNQLEVPGIDGGTVITEHLYNDSRLSLEKLIDITNKSSNKDIKINNFSHGAVINGTINSNNENNNLKEILDTTILKSSIIETIDKQFKIYSEPINIDFPNISDRINKLIQLIKSNIKDNITIYEFMDIHDNIYSEFKTLFKDYDYMEHTLRGTLSNILSKIYIFSAPHADGIKVSAFIKESLELLCNCLEEIQIEFPKLNDKIDISTPGFLLDK